MRRPHVYERSVTRAARGSAARAAVAVLPDLLRQAEAAGAVVLARYLGQALMEAEGMVRRAS